MGFRTGPFTVGFRLGLPHIAETRMYLIFTEVKTVNIIVCIKQVPGTSNVKVDPVTGTLIRDGVESKMNPYDLFALETGLKLKEQCGGTLRVVSMGPPPATAVLNEAVWMGADSGVLVSDRKFGGADVLATSYTISQAIKAMGDYDLILTGKQTTDGDTAQVGSELAEFLGLPHCANVHSAELCGDGRIRYTAGLDNKVVTATVSTPCLLCIEADVNTPRLPSYRRKKATDGNTELIKVLTFADFADQDSSHYGLAGSPTQVERIFPPEKNTDREIIEDDFDAAADKVFNILTKKKFI